MIATVIKTRDDERRDMMFLNLDHQDDGRNDNCGSER